MHSIYRFISFKYLWTFVAAVPFLMSLCMTKNAVTRKGNPRRWNHLPHPESQRKEKATRHEYVPECKNRLSFIYAFACFMQLLRECNFLKRWAFFVFCIFWQCTNVAAQILMRSLSEDWLSKKSK